MAPGALDALLSVGGSGSCFCGALGATTEASVVRLRQVALARTAANPPCRATAARRAAMAQSRPSASSLSPLRETV